MMLALLALLVQREQEKPLSGPQKGEKTPAFKVLDLEGKERDWVTEWKGAPALIVFVHELTRPGAQLMRKLDDHAARRGIKSLLVLLGDDVNKNERYAPVLQGIVKFKSTLGVSPDGKEGPGAYGLNKEVQVTVLLAKDDLVAGNWALTQPNDTDTPGITKAIDELLGVKPDPLEERVAALEKEVRELRALVERLQQAQKPQPERKLPPAPKDATLNGLMRRLIRKEAAEADVDAIVKEIEEHIQGKDDLKKEAIDGYALLKELKYGTEHAQKRIGEALEALKK